MHLSGTEKTFAEDEIIVSKTDLAGQIIYANDVFLTVSGYAESELLGQSQNIVRHPEVPGCIFDKLWTTIAEGGEIFTYLVNRCANGDHYWVFAHFAPSYAKDGSINGYHSAQRVANPLALEKISPLYRQLLEEEGRHSIRVDGIKAAAVSMRDLLDTQGTNYDKLVFSLQTLQPSGH